ncbi:MAG: 16S rRNA (guanine(966)-N(2))-methyltransferase RsmD, partial [Candidatus Dadabacteria bacterium]
MGYVRITSGTLRGRRVQTPEGQGTRPLLTRLRKSLAD